jgi:hypothetical protein
MTSDVLPQTGEHAGPRYSAVLALPRSGAHIARTVRDGVVFAGRAVLTGGK